MTDAYNQLVTTNGSLVVNYIPAPTAAIVGSPLTVNAGDNVTLDARASVCTTPGSCTFAWTVACPGKATVFKAGDPARLTTGAGASFEIDLRGAEATVTCAVGLRVDGDFGLTHAANTTLQVGLCLDQGVSGLQRRHASEKEVPLAPPQTRHTTLVRALSLLRTCPCPPHHPSSGCRHLPAHAWPAGHSA